MNSEQVLRKIIRKKIRASIREQHLHERALRKVIRQLLNEGDISDVHPHRATGINMLEDVLKKSIPTLRTDFKRLTTDKKQRDSFRAHMINAVIDALKPEQVKSNYRQGSETGEPSALLSEPVGTDFGELEEAEIDVDIVDDYTEKKIPVEDDDTPTEEEEFGSGLEGMDETGRNMAYTSFRKI